MDAKELETYQVQLSHVEETLKSDPENAELKELAKELRELIELTTASLEASGSGSGFGSANAMGGGSGEGGGPTYGGGSGGGYGNTTSTQKKHSAHAQAQVKSWSAGDDCLAKYSGDGQWYPARITSVGGAESHKVYSVVFKGYNTTELLKSSELKVLPASYQVNSSSSSGNPYLSASSSYSGTPPPSGGGGGGGGGMSKRKITKEEEEERDRKKKRNEKKLETRAAKAAEQNAKQASWQKFAKKSEKKGVHIAGVSGTSIFKTPDNPLGKVGVTGSGKGMTENAPRPKNKFSKVDDE